MSVAIHDSLTPRVLTGCVLSRESFTIPPPFFDMGEDTGGGADSCLGLRHPQRWLPGINAERFFNA